MLVGMGENAGVVDVGEGLAVTFKVESHNHPSYVEPYQGAATGIGGIVRDILTMGARPILVMDPLRFGDADHPDTQRVFPGVVAYYLGNPNGSMRDIAGITNERGNVVGIMPHPEHAVEDLTGPGTDGLGFFTSVLKAMV
jgi:hypothetical protein